MSVEIKSVSDTVADYLRHQIIVGRLGANQRINENDLASDLGVSRPPIREAFRTLESEHLIVSVPRKGTYVADVSIEDLTGLYQTREMIEGYAISLLKSMKVRELPHVEATLQEASSLTLPSVDNPDELRRFLKAFVGFHSGLVEATGNPRIIRFYESISLHLTRYQMIYFFVPGSLGKSTQDHAEILNLIKERKFGEAKRSLLKHIRYTTEVLKNKMLQNQFGRQEGVPWKSVR
jgi:DNA-binding GntR family transcriptional regulator